VAEGLSERRVFTGTVQRTSAWNRGQRENAAVSTAWLLASGSDGIQDHTCGGTAQSPAAARVLQSVQPSQPVFVEQPGGWRLRQGDQRAVTEVVAGWIESQLLIRSGGLRPRG